MGRSRPGLTLVELLIAAALGMTILGLGLQQLMEYFRLQQVLITRTQLRTEARHALETIAQHMRYLNDFGPTTKGFVGLAPLDDNHDAVLGKGDRYRVVLWRMADDPVNPGEQILQEHAITVPAFFPVRDRERVLPLFETQLPRGKRLASHVSGFALNPRGSQLTEVQLEVSQKVARQPEPVLLRFTEMVACRNILLADTALPKLDEVLAELKGKKKAP